MSSRRHGPLIARAASHATAAERARALGRHQSEDVLRELAREAARGDRSALIALARGLDGGCADPAGGERTETWKIVERLMAALQAGALVFLPVSLPVSLAGSLAGRGSAVGGSGAAQRSGARSTADPDVHRATRGLRQIEFEGCLFRIVLAAAGSKGRDPDGNGGRYEAVPLEEAQRLIRRMTLVLPRSIDEQMAWERVHARLSPGASALPAPVATDALALLRRRRAPGPQAAPERAVDPANGQPRARARLRFRLQLFDAASGAPVAGAALRVLTPDGSTHQLDTDGAGRIDIPDLDAGRCEVESRIAGALIQRSFSVDEDAGAGPPEVATSAGHGDLRPGRRAWIVGGERYRLRTGDDPEGIATRAGVAWNDIALFNWGTAEPGALEACYRDMLGCTRRTADGRRYRFDDRDDPGILHIPRAWTASLSVGPLHRVAVRPLRAIFISLENEAGLRLPGVEYEVALGGEGRRQGRLGAGGVARLDGVPEGAFLVSYPDEAGVRAVSLAASVRRAFDQQVAGPLFHLLMHPRDVVLRALAAYRDHFDDLTGRGLIDDIDQVITDPEARAPLLALAEQAGIAVPGQGGAAPAARAA